MPSGTTSFEFDAGNLSFTSGTYQWLVVSGSSGMAQYKGTGTINGVAGYGFLLTAYDAGVKGTGSDGFRIKITDSSGTVVYDNLASPDDGDVASNTEPIGGGNIVIHTLK